MPGGLLASEDGPWSSDTVSLTYANRLRTGLTLLQPTSTWTNRFTWDAAVRLASVVSPAGTFTYNYNVGQSVSPASLVQSLSLPGGNYITNIYDPLARLAGTWLKKSDNTILDSATYGYNAGNQRTWFTNAAGTYVGFAYDNIGQLKVADSSVNTEDRKSVV